MTAAPVPQVGPAIGYPPDPAPLTISYASGLVLAHLRARKTAAEIIARHPDPYLALI